MITGTFESIAVLVSASSAMPDASLPMILAVAGAITSKSALCAIETCWGSYSRFHQ